MNLTKIFLTIITIVLFQNVNAQDENKLIKTDFKGKINNEELKFIKQQFDWNEEKILIINYTQLRSDCHFDNHKHLKEGGKWWKKFYSKIELNNCLNKFACSEKHKGISDLYIDRTNYFLKNYFSHKKSCFAVLVINKNGDYMQYNGHYSEEQVSHYIKTLKSPL